MREGLARKGPRAPRNTTQHDASLHHSIRLFNFPFIPKSPVHSSFHPSIPPSVRPSTASAHLLSPRHPSWLPPPPSFQVHILSRFPLPPCPSLSLHQTPAQEVTKELEHNFGIDPTKPKPPAQPQPQLQQQQGAARTPPPSTLTTASRASKAPNEVLEPHTAPPGARPHIGAGETTMQNFCGASSPNWGPLVGGHFSPCFVQSFLFGAVDVAFVCLAVLRFRDLLALPPPPPRSLTRGQLTKVVCCSLVAVYNLVMFAVHLAFDYGQPYQWLMYPLSCMTWSLCTALLLCEARYGAPTNYVCRSFWISSFACATVMLWTNASDEAVSRRDFGAFMVHFALYGAMAALAVIHREDSQDYSALAIDFSEVSYEDEQTEATEETRTAAGGDGSVKAGGGVRGMSGGGGGGGGGASSGTLKRLVLLFAEEKWLVAASFACCLIGTKSPLFRV